MDENMFADYLVNHLNLIEEGLKLISREHGTIYGVIDFLCEDKN